MDELALYHVQLLLNTKDEESLDWHFLKGVFTLVSISVILLLPSIQLAAGQAQSQTSAGENSQVGSTFIDVYHGYEIQHPANWQAGDYGITDGEFTLVARFDRGIPPEPFLNIAFTDLSNRGQNLTLDEFTAEEISRIEEPAMVGDEVLYESEILESEPAILANRTAHRVVWEEHLVEEELVVDSSTDRKMSIWTIVGDKVWELTYVAPDIQSYSEHLATAEAMFASFTLLPKLELTEYNEYTNAQMEVKLQFPLDWSHEEDTGMLFLRPPTSAATNKAVVTVLSSEFPTAIDIDAYAEMNLEVTEEEMGADVLAHGFTSISGYPAWYAIFEDTASELFGLQVGVLKGSTEYIVSYAAVPDTFDTHVPAVRAIIESFEITSEDTLDSSFLEDLEQELDEILGLDSSDSSPSGSGTDENDGSDSPPSSSSGSRCPDGFHRSPSGDCERVTDTRGMPRCPDGYHRSPDGDCERVS